MPRITPVDWKTLRRVFELYGCAYKRKKGSHHILICPGAKRAVVIPECNEIGVSGTWRGKCHATQIFHHRLVSTACPHYAQIYTD